MTQASPTPLEPSATSPDAELMTAYHVAAGMQAARVNRGAIFTGRKIGFTNKTLWEQFGVTAPIWGAMYEQTMFHAREGIAHCRPAEFSEPKIEPEIIFYFREAPPTSAAPSDLLACIDWIAHGFEIVQSHAPGWRFTAAEAIMDGSLHAALVLGSPVPIAALGDDPKRVLEQVTVTLSCDGRVVETGTGANVLGSPLNAVSHLITELARCGMPPIAAGEVITTGSMTAAYSISPGQRWASTIAHAPFEGLTLVCD